jgi:hypothetical protein
LESKAYRDAYVLEHIKNGIAFQIRTLREDRDWTQGKLGELAKKPRNVISRLEDPNYGKFTLATLLEVASAFDVGLMVKFVPFSRLVREYDDVSPEALSAKPAFSNEEAQALSMWAAEVSAETLTAGMTTTSDSQSIQNTDINRHLQVVEPQSTHTGKTRAISKSGTYQNLPLFDRPIGIVGGRVEVPNPSTLLAGNLTYDMSNHLVKTA